MNHLSYWVVCGGVAVRAQRSGAVPVSGGVLHVGHWPGAGVPVLAAHGITAHHGCWQWLVDALPDRQLLAPDLRGRGRSHGGSAAPAGRAGP